MVERALALDPEDPEAHITLGGLRVQEWRWQEAEAAYHRARQLGSEFQDYGGATAYLIAQGKLREALKLSRAREERDPLSAASAQVVGFHLYLSRDFDSAIEACERALEIDPEREQVLELLGNAHAQAGHLPESVQAYERWARASGLSDDDIARLKAMTGAEGLPGLWRFLLSLEERDEAESGNVWPYRRALFHARLGEREAAFHWLDAAFAESQPRLNTLGSEPGFDSVRSDPRFDGYLRRMNLDPEAFAKPVG